MARFRLPGGTLDIESRAVMEDPQGGPPIEVSSRLQPDPMALYFLGSAIVNATRAIERYLRWQKIAAITLVFLMGFSAANFVLSFWFR
jgi:hypothetical protein